MTGTILIADALATNRITLKVKLEAACYRVVTADCVGRAVADARALRPDLILSEVGLPGGGAETLCRQLRTAGQEALPVIVLGDAGARLSALRAGASEVLDKPADELFLLARIRQLLGDAAEQSAANELAEEASDFAGLEPPARITLIAPDAGVAFGWKHALAGRGRHELAVSTAERALAQAAQGVAADLYLIAADLSQTGDGLRLLAELKARPASRDAAFLIALPPSREAIAPMALDLGAGDILPLSLGGTASGEEAALRVDAQLRRKRRADRRRAGEKRERLWAVVDPLTGLHNRRYALPRLASLVTEAQGWHRQNLAVMVLDLDCFKSINDRHGHAAGDAVLTTIAARLAGQLGSADLLARIGGEEFLVALPGCNPRQAEAAAERLRRAVGAMPVLLPPALGASRVNVTCSVGVTCLARCAGNDNTTPEAVLHRADRALLAAKALGRDRVISDIIHAAA